MTPEERELEIESRLRAIRGHSDFPTLAGQLQEVVRIAQDEDTALDRLANVVLSSYGLTLKVLRTVNSFYYNRSGQPILSVARAVVLLGVRTVRELATSFLVFDHYQRQSPELRRLMLLSMTSASHAEALARWAHDVDPEAAYVCGMFRNLGEVLIAHYFPEDYTAIQRERGGDRGDPAYRLLGFRYEELGAAMARSWGMPMVGEMMLPVGTGTALRAVTSLGHALTTALYRGEDRVDPATLDRLLERYRRDVPVPADQVPAMLESAAAAVRNLFLGLGASPGELELLTRSEPRPETVAAAGEPAPAPLDIGSVRESREPLLREVASVIGGPDFSIRRALLMVLEALQRAGPFDRAFLCLIDDDCGEVRARLALGAEADRAAAKFRFPIGSHQTVLGAALADQEPVFATPATYGPKEARWAKLLGAEDFTILPLAVDRRSVGCLYCDRKVSLGALDPGTLIFLGRVQSVAEQAIVRSRAAAVIPGPTPLD